FQCAEALVPGDFQDFAVGLERDLSPAVAGGTREVGHQRSAGAEARVEVAGAEQPARFQRFGATRAAPADATSFSVPMRNTSAGGARHAPSPDGGTMSRTTRKKWVEPSTPRRAKSYCESGGASTIFRDRLLRGDADATPL